MSGLSSIRDLITLWPTRASLTDDLKVCLPAGVPVSVHQVQKWAEKQSIPARYHYAVICAARARGLDVSADDLVRLHGAVLSSVSSDRGAAPARGQGNEVADG